MQRTAGDSGTPLAKKLGIREGAAIVTIGQPENYRALVSPLPDGARIVTRLPKTPEFLQGDVSRRASYVHR